MGPFLPFVLLVLLFLLSQVVIIAVMAAQDTNKDDPVSRDGQQEEMMPLSPPQTSEGNSHTLPQLKFGEKMRFDDMGPVIVNKDGTTRYACYDGRQYQKAPLCLLHHHLLLLLISL